jgi:hypothetical protein
MFSQITPNSAKIPNTSVASPREATMEEETIYQVQNHMETKEVEVKNQAKNK